jgi:RND family efflux transporter MFP subunit
MSTDRLHELRIDRGEEKIGASGGRARWWVAATAILLVGLATWWLASRNRAPQVTLAVAEITSGSSQPASVLDASGYVTARRQATVSSKITGKVEEVLLEEGMAVEEGQVLARLDDSSQRVLLELARAQEASAAAAIGETRAQLREADLALERSRRLVAQSVSSQAELDAALAARDGFAARLARQERDAEAARETVSLRRQELEDTVIRAPFSGVMVTKDAQPGEMISPVSAGGGFTRTGIGTVVDMASLEIEVDVNEAYIQRVHDEQPVTAVLDAYPDWRIPARVITLVPTADRQKATVKVRIGFDELDPRILPDMGVKVSFAAEAKDGEAVTGSLVVVPAAAVVSRDDRDVIFVAVNGSVERRAVQVADRRGEVARISAGLTGGERVVVAPPATLEDGSKIREEGR